VATRENFRAENYEAGLEKLKLEDGVRLQPGPTDLGAARLYQLAFDRDDGDTDDYHDEPPKIGSP
jgi:hypothetical protein